ncbi:MAG: glycosyltransferase family 4 protein [Sedimentisphaerales bacterium]|nr:glycosyltransferase family 4 protein [Sedimentisphaerales bacterium]
MYSQLIPLHMSDRTIYAGGAQKRTCQMAEHFASHGWYVYFASDDEPESRIVRRLVSSGVVFNRIPFRISKFMAAFCIAQLSYYIRKYEISILHANDRWTAALGYLAAQLTKCKTIYTARNVFSDKRFTRFLYGENIIAVSDAVKENLYDDFHIHQSRITVIHNGTDIKHSTEEERRRVMDDLHLSDENRIISVIGRLTQQKGLDFLLMGLKSVIELYPRIRVLFVGDGEKREHLKGIVKKNKMQDNVVFCGNVEAVAPYIDISEFTVMSSLWEGLPGGAIESMMLTKPVIATSVGGLPEVVLHGKNGLLVPPCNPCALSDAIKYLLASPHRTREMGECGHRTANEKFSLTHMMSKYEKYYLELLQ